MLSLSAPCLRALKGSHLAADGVKYIEVPIGSDGQVLTADSSQAAGVSWQGPGSAFGAAYQFSSIQEEIVIANAATTDSVSNLIPANSIIYGVVARITGALLNARTWSLGVAGATALFAAAGQSGVLGTLINTLSTGTVSPGGPAAGPLVPFQGSATGAADKVRITLSNADGGNGTTTKIRVCVFFATLSNLTS